MKKLKTVITALEDIKIEDIVVFDMREVNPFFDFFILSTATNNRQMNAAIRDVKQALSRHDQSASKKEGHDSGWALFDAGDIIVNIFTKEAREYYNLEKMWLDIPKVNLNKL